MAYRDFIVRRGLRILLPCVAAMAIGWLAGAPDLRAHPWWYLSQLANFHIACLSQWPSGTSHYWSLAIQSQFYLVWPLVVLWLPRRALAPVIFVTIFLAPLSRYLLETRMPHIAHPGAITGCALDYLGMGALLALGFHRGIDAGKGWIRKVAWAAALVYSVFYVLDESGRTLPVLGYFQQTFLSVALAGIIAASLSGLPGWLAAVLVHPATQHVARLSYSLYLLHTLIPILLGHVLPVLWKLPDHGPGLGLRLAVFALATWGLSWVFWRFVEQPVERIRSRFPA